MRQRLFILLVFIVHTLSGQNSDVNPIVNQEQLKWGGDYRYKSNPYDTAYGFYTFYLKTISYTKNGVELWTVNLPKRMQTYKAQSIYDRKTDSVGNGQKMSKEEIDVNKYYHNHFLKCPLFITDNIIAISDLSGFLIMDKRNGSILNDISYKQNKDLFRCDKGNYEIEMKKNTCGGTISYGSSFITICGENLFHFNEQELFVWTDENTLSKRIKYKRALHAVKSNTPLHYKALIKDKDFSVQMEGWVFVE